MVEIRNNTNAPAHTTSGTGKLAVKVFRTDGSTATRRMPATAANRALVIGQAELLATAPSTVHAQVIVGTGRAAQIIFDTNNA